MLPRSELCLVIVTTVLISASCCAKATSLTWSRRSTHRGLAAFTRSHVVPRPSRLGYRIIRADDNDSKERNISNGGNEKNSPSSRPSGGSYNSPCIPVLGPFPGKPPLLIGADFVLDGPTPMQWQTLEEAVVTHYQGMNSANKNAARIHAAPLVAIIDEHTGSGEICSPGGAYKNPYLGRYATIAAIVGIVEGTSDERRCNDSFMDSISRIARKRGLMSPLKSRIRLVGIGRASLQHLYYQVPTNRCEAVDDQGHLLLDDAAQSSIVSDKSAAPHLNGDAPRVNGDATAPISLDDFPPFPGIGGDDDDDEEEVECLLATQNIVMANFVLVQDSLHRSAPSSPSAFSSHSNVMHHSKVPATSASPVHALHEMSRIANAIHRLHLDRRKMVQSLQAARWQAPSVKVIEWDDDLMDYDGLGMLANRAATPAALMSPPPTSAHAVSPIMDDGPTTSAALGATGLRDLENYGMGYSAASISDLFNLTRVWVEKLTPYFSPQRVASEEFYYETYSFVAFLALDHFESPYRLGWALRCTNTIERLQDAYERFREHNRLLQREVELVREELQRAGISDAGLWAEQ
jgi:hypothetical protein